MMSLRRNWVFKIVFCILLLFFFYIIIKNDEYRFFYPLDDDNTETSNNYSESLVSNKKYDDSKLLNPNDKHEMVVAVVACGERLQETLTMLKSCLMFSSKSPLRFIIIADETLRKEFVNKLSEWQQILNGSFRFEVLGLKFPEKNKEEWRKLFKPCASQRLFLPTILTHIDSLIYVDTDTLFLSSVDSLWKHFNEFNSTHMAALALEHEDSNLSWYSRFAKHPFYGKFGVNSGVMLMNLTRMRTFRWEEYVTSVYNRWQTQLTWGDQDIINIIFHYHSERLFLLDCDANYRPDQCAYGPACTSAVKNGARVLHGSRGAFHSSKHPAFGAVHKSIRHYQLGTDPTKNFLDYLLMNLHNSPESNCGKLEEALTKIPVQYFGKTNAV